MRGYAALDAKAARQAEESKRRRRLNAWIAPLVREDRKPRKKKRSKVSSKLGERDRADWAREAGGPEPEFCWWTLETDEGHRVCSLSFGHPGLCRAPSLRLGAG